MELSSSRAGRANIRKQLAHEEQKSSPLKNIVFRKKNKNITNLTKLNTYDTVSITLTLHKNKYYFDTITQHTNSSTTQNPVIIWANIYRHVIDIKGATMDTTVNAFYNTTTDWKEYITSV